MAAFAPLLRRLATTLIYVSVAAVATFALLRFGPQVAVIEPWATALAEALRVEPMPLLGVGLGAGTVAWLLRGLVGPQSDDGTSLPGLRWSALDVRPDASIAMLAETATEVRALATRRKPDMVAAFNRLVGAAFSVGASDIHVSPERERSRIHMRVDGVLHEVCDIDGGPSRMLVNRIKVLAGLSLHVHAKPQDGRVVLDRDDLQLRVSTLPTNHGEKVVIRLAVHDERRYVLDAIGFAPRDLALYRTLLQRDQGVVFFTGPTGSGKTTTMYASLLHIRDTRGDTANIVTLEDPIEVDFNAIAQTQVNVQAGMTFALGLRSVLRQDPDVIMVGEIRDEETAETALRAGLTGHLLLTSLHAGSAAGVFTRLKQLEVDRAQLAGATVGVINQRLAIRNCPDCTRRVEVLPVTAQQLEVLGIDPAGPFHAGAGCDQCRGTGRRGRSAIVEILAVTDRVRDAIVDEEPTHRLVAIAIEDGMRPLAEQALERAHAGEIPVEEMIRVLSLA